jgi:GTP-binding protein Era
VPPGEPMTESEDRESSPDGAGHRTGFVALVGPPNAGKSTLLNRLLGQKLAIVTAKPQTTRSRILGIHSLPNAQLLFVDTPGLHESDKMLNEALNDSVDAALADCDLALLLVDLGRGWTATHDVLWRRILQSGRPGIIVGTKLDLVADGESPSPLPPELEKAEFIRISAKTGEGVPALFERAVLQLPESPPLYDPDELTDRPLRWLSAELVREAAYETLSKELPYSIAVEVIQFDESRSDRIEIHANLLVERNSQKRIVVGKGGQVIKQIGVRARREIERLVDRKVNLQLFVKIDPSWLKSRKRIHSLGYH